MTVISPCGGVLRPPRDITWYDKLQDAHRSGDMERAIQIRYEHAVDHCRFDPGCYKHHGWNAMDEERAWWKQNRPDIYEAQVERPNMENPKEAQAASDGKAPLDYLEPYADEQISWVMKVGAEKYGRRNYKHSPMQLTTYIGAMERHLAALKRGEMLDPDDGRHHLAHIGANVHVTMGAIEAGTFVDDSQEYNITPRSNAVHVNGDQQVKSSPPNAAQRQGNDYHYPFEV